MNYLTTLDGAEEFFKRCAEREAVTLDERLKILEEMKAERRVFKQTDEQVKQRINNKNVLKIKSEVPKNG